MMQTGWRPNVLGKLIRRFVHQGNPALGSMSAAAKWAPRGFAAAFVVTAASLSARAWNSATYFRGRRLIPTRP